MRIHAQHGRKKFTIHISAKGRVSFAFEQNAPYHETHNKSIAAQYLKTWIIICKGGVSRGTNKNTASDFVRAAELERARVRVFKSLGRGSKYVQTTFQERIATMAENVVYRAYCVAELNRSTHAYVINVSLVRTGAENVVCNTTRVHAHTAGLPRSYTYPVTQSIHTWYVSAWTLAHSAWTLSHRNGRTFRIGPFTEVRNGRGTSLVNHKVNYEKARSRNKRNTSDYAQV